MDRNAFLSRRAVIGGLAIVQASATGQLASAATHALDNVSGAPDEPTNLQKPDRVTVPILVYHIITPGPPPSSQMARWLRVTPLQFEAHLKQLSGAEYSSVTFGAIRDALEGTGRLPNRPIVITFDDGWENQYQYAFPLLLKYGFTATLFVVTKFIDRTGFLSTNQLREMITQGMEVGSHSCTHPRLDLVQNTLAVWREISSSKEILEDKLAVKIDAFAYPYGSYNKRVVKWVEAAGYRAARTIDVDFEHSLKTINTLGGTTFDFLPAPRMLDVRA
jgi:peptidoglycan/xylan/chitin deacetylase (PgdA/CDA1 family)